MEDCGHNLSSAQFWAVSVKSHCTSENILKKKKGEIKIFSDFKKAKQNPQQKTTLQEIVSKCPLGTRKIIPDGNMDLHKRMKNTLNVFKK